MTSTSRLGVKSLLLERSCGYRLFQNLISKPETMHRLKDRFFPEVDRAGCRVLDLGCGPANFLESLGDPSTINYVGFDPHPDYIESARQKFPLRRFLVGTSDTLAHEIDEKFDLAVLSGVLHHLDDGQAENIVRFAVERLETGGKLLTIDPVILDRQNPVARLLARSDRGGFVRGPDRYLGIVAKHIRVREHTVLSDMLRVPYNHFVTVGVNES